MTNDTFALMFERGMKIIAEGFVSLLTLAQVATSSNNEGPINKAKLTTPNNTDSIFSTDTIVSILFVFHLAAVIAFIISHCRVVKQKSQ